MQLGCILCQTKYYEVFKKTGSIFDSMDKYEKKEEGKISGRE